MDVVTVQVGRPGRGGRRGRRPVSMDPVDSVGCGGVVAGFGCPDERGGERQHPDDCHQRHAVGHTALLHDLCDVIGDADEFLPLLRVEEQVVSVNLHLMNWRVGEFKAQARRRR